ncbi:MAG: hypothetical protein ACJAWV_002247 [Flammeovirgaceae bacterium]|jgi:hypothetical protein
MKIAIWGSLNYGNFGDDVMNVIFALEVQKMGATPYLYRLDKGLAKQYGLHTVDNLDDLLKDASFSFIGGGSWLESRKLGDAYEKDFDDYLDKLEHYKVPFYAISIGGDSVVDKNLLTEDRIRLFSSPLFKGGTVRLREAVELLGQFDKKVELFPDIVLRSSEYFLSQNSTPSNTGNKFRIGISWSASKHVRKLMHIIKFTPLIYDKYEIFFLNTHLPKYNMQYEESFNIKSEKINNFQYENLEGFYDFIKSLDCVISSKLHPGVAGLSCKVPFFWIPGYDKTRSFLKSVDLAEYEFTEWEIIKLLLSKNIVGLAQSYDFKELENLQTESVGHINYIQDIITEFGHDI